MHVKLKVYIAFFESVSCSKKSDDMSLQVVTAAFHLGRQSLGVLFSVLKLHLEEVEYVVSHLNQECQDLFLARSEQRGVAFVKCQVSTLKDLHIFSQSLRVAAHKFYRH